VDDHLIDESIADPQLTCRAERFSMPHQAPMVGQRPRWSTPSRRSAAPSAAPGTGDQPVREWSFGDAVLARYGMLTGR
jgi:hypothetical protein